MSPVNPIVSRVVTFDYKGKPHKVTLDTNTSWETVLGIIKLMFNLKPPFTLSFETNRGLQLGVHSTGQLHTFLKSNYDNHILNINHSNLPKEKVAFAHQKESKAPNNPAPSRDTNSSVAKDVLIKKEYNAFDLMESNKTTNDISSSSSSASTSDSEVSFSSKDPYTAFHEDDSSSGTCNDQALTKAYDPLEKAQELQTLLGEFVTLFNNHPSTLLPSEILIDQVLEGVDINMDVLEKKFSKACYLGTRPFSIQA
ncbi:hypothetical protein DSO57_1022644 [Entomophthora muscae]|uniref:Uncharacterized protein n=1 Tax=Entomophthora muscae TaxID=34485 RepID=A0ACC2SFP6_9FUNG|nr:hypothetical protein DSO57_1022644 [Entomophthora muscae]